ncbi:hypothetical protein V6N13_119491 [Hibiscus sabdariffa]
MYFTVKPSSIPVIIKCLSFEGKLFGASFFDGLNSGLVLEVDSGLSLEVGVAFATEPAIGTARWFPGVPSNVGLED